MRGDRATLAAARFLREVLDDRIKQLEAGDGSGSTTVRRMLRGAFAAKSDQDVSLAIIALVLRGARDRVRAERQGGAAGDVVSWTAAAREHAFGALEGWTDDEIAEVIEAPALSVALSEAFRKKRHAMSPRRVEQLLKRRGPEA